MTIPEAIKEAAASGLRGLTLWPTQDGQWQANVTYDGTGWRCETHADPVTALERALGASAVSEMTNDTLEEDDIFS